MFADVEDMTFVRVNSPRRRLQVIGRWTGARDAMALMPLKSA
jgi:hypothetical protein